MFGGSEETDPPGGAAPSKGEDADWTEEAYPSMPRVPRFLRYLSQ